MQSGQRTRSQLKENHAAAGLLLLLQLLPGGETHNTLIRPTVVHAADEIICSRVGIQPELHKVQQGVDSTALHGEPAPLGRARACDDVEQRAPL